jgi:methylmalonyl-CoA/ethylmalonyl-CoA epimerase
LQKGILSLEDNTTAVPFVRNWTPTGAFHHVGFVVASIERDVQSFAESLDATWGGNTVHDPQQGVYVTFLQSRNSGDPLVELIEPAGESSPVLSFLKRGGGLHHVCYLVDALENKLEECRAQGGHVVRPPTAAVAFGGRRIAWVYTKNKLLIEYLER